MRQFELMNEVPDYVISLRLAQIQQAYGGIALAGAIQRAKRQNNSQPKSWAEIHIINLMETYGTEAVSNLYDSVYTLVNSRKSA